MKNRRKMNRKRKIKSTNKIGDPFGDRKIPKIPKDYTLMTTNEVCEMLKLKRVTIVMWRWKKKNLNYIKSGRNVLYYRKHVQDFLDKRTISSGG